MKKTFKNKTAVIVSVCLALALIIGGAYGFLSARDSKINRFTRGTLSLSLTENNWNEANARNLMPQQIVSKNPQVINDNEENISAWIFMSVKVPSTNEEYEGSNIPVDRGADGCILNAEDIGEYYDLFNIRYNGCVGINTDDWELVAYDASERNHACGYTTYYYVYTSGALDGYDENDVAESPTGISTELFDKIQLANITNRPELGTILNSIDVQGSGIQQLGISDVYTAWAIYSNQNNGTNNTSNFTYVNDNYQVTDGVIAFN